VPFLAQSSAKSSIRFYGFEFLSNTVDSFGIDRSKNAAAWSLLCGLGAGAIESMCLTAPTDRIKVLKQALSAERGGNPITASQLIRERGFSTLYVGGLSTTLRQSSSVAVRFTCFSKIKGAVCGAAGYDTSNAPVWVSFMAGGAGGALSVCLNNPIDVAKSKIQAGVHTSIVGCIRSTVAEQGVMGLTAGLSARMPRLFLSQAIQFSIVDYIKTLLQ
jgi:solute carrier family 25 citrate transporter 1